MSTPLSSVLVVGGCGFLGNWIVRLLKELHPEASLSVADLKTEHNRYDKVNYYDCDITNAEQVESIMKRVGPQVVINTVSPVTGLGAAIYHKVNVEGNQLLVETAKKHAVKAFVYTSSASVVFNGTHDVRNADESVPHCKPHMDAYNETKATAEKFILRSNDPNGMRTCALRVSGLFGPGDRQFIPGLLDVMNTGKTKWQIGDNENLFDVTYIENAAYAHLLAAEKLISSEAGKVDGEAFFITNGEPMYFWDWCRSVWAQFGHVNQKVTVLPFSLGLVLASIFTWIAWLTRKEPVFTEFKIKYSALNRYFNIKKARVLLEYSPRVTIAEGVVRACDAFKEEQNKKVY